MTRRLTRPAIALAVLASAVIPAHAQYKVLKTVKVGGEGGSDYLYADSDARRLYIARSGATAVAAIHVYDLDTFAEVGTIPGVSAHGATIDTKYHHGFATSKPVTMFDSVTLKVIKTIDTGGNPDGYLLDPVADRVYILSHSAPNITVLDAKDGAILGTVDVGAAVEQSQLDGKGHLFVDLEDKDAVAVIDTATLKVTAKYDVSSKGGGCAGLGIDTEHGVLFASCRDKHNMIVLNAADGTILDVLPEGVGSDGVVFDPATMEAFSSQGDGTLTVVKEYPTGPATLPSFGVGQTVATPLRARTITLDSKTGHLLLMTAEYGPAPAPGTPGGRPGRAPMVPGSFEIIVVGK